MFVEEGHTCCRTRVVGIEDTKCGLTYCLLETTCLTLVNSSDLVCKGLQRFLKTQSVSNMPDFVY